MPENEYRFRLAAVCDNCHAKVFPTKATSFFSDRNQRKDSALLSPLKLNTKDEMIILFHLLTKIAMVCVGLDVFICGDD